MDCLGPRIQGMQFLLLCIGFPRWLTSLRATSNEDMTRRIIRSMTRQSQIQMGALMLKEELEVEDSQVFNMFQIIELDL